MAASGAAWRFMSPSREPTICTAPCSTTCAAISGTPTRGRTMPAVWCAPKTGSMSTGPAEVVLSGSQGLRRPEQVVLFFHVFEGQAAHQHGRRSQHCADSADEAGEFFP